MFIVPKYVEYNIVTLFHVKVLVDVNGLGGSTQHRSLCSELLNGNLCSQK